MEGTRQSIIKILQCKSYTTVAELSKALELSTATLRRHLDILQRDGLVEYGFNRKQKGRPEFFYALTEAGQESLPKDYHRLLSMFLEQVAQVDKLTLESVNTTGGGNLVQRLFASVSDKVASRFLRKADPDTNFSPSRVLTTLLEEENFFPETQEKEGKLQINLLNCPFRSVALNNPLVCVYDSSLIEHIAKNQPSREVSIHDGSPYCTYTVIIRDE